MDVDDDGEVSTGALLKNETVKEEFTDTKTKAIERIKSGSNENLFSRKSGERKDGV